MNTMQVAARLRCRYQKARDLMLSGKLGDPDLDPLSVKRADVEAFIAERTARIKAKNLAASPPLKHGEGLL